MPNPMPTARTLLETSLQLSVDPASCEHLEAISTNLDAATTALQSIAASLIELAHYARLETNA